MFVIGMIFIEIARFLFLKNKKKKKKVVVT
jgi:hypothetical protein